MTIENETHEEVCAEMRSFGDEPPPMFAWRDLAERAEAAHKRDIKSLKWKVENYASVVATKDAEIAKRDALIKKLTIAFNNLKRKICKGAVVTCKNRGKLGLCKFCALVAKAREVVK